MNIKMASIRLNKYIAESGICSRRKADELIDNKRVKVNGFVVGKGTVIDSEKDKVEVDGKIIKQEDKKVYILLNKPEGYVTTVSEQFNRPCVIDLIKEEARVYPVGRLDMYTTGLLILTNDGDFANSITHPKHQIYKTYEVETEENLSNQDIIKLQKGVNIGGYITKEAKVKKISNNKINITIGEGKNRQVRKMIEAVHNKVVKLNRSKIGELTLDNLKQGEYKYLSKKELELIYK